MGDAVDRALRHVVRAGGTVIIYLAALTGVPPSCTTPPRSTAPAIWHKIWHVTLPQLRGVLFVTLILQVIGTVRCSPSRSCSPTAARPTRR